MSSTEINLPSMAKILAESVSQQLEEAIKAELLSVATQVIEQRAKEITAATLLEVRQAKIFGKRGEEVIFYFKFGTSPQEVLK